jgi:hypothetical protein
LFDQNDLGYLLVPVPLDGVKLPAAHPIVLLLFPSLAQKFNIRVSLQPAMSAASEASRDGLLMVS